MCRTRPTRALYKLVTWLGCCCVVGWLIAVVCSASCGVSLSLLSAELGYEAGFLACLVAGRCRRYGCVLPWRQLHHMVLDTRIGLPLALWQPLMLSGVSGCTVLTCGCLCWVSTPVVGCFCTIQQQLLAARICALFLSPAHLHTPCGPPQGFGVCTSMRPCGSPTLLMWSCKAGSSQQGGALQSVAHPPAHCSRGLELVPAVQLLLAAWVAGVLGRLYRLGLHACGADGSCIRLLLLDFVGASMTIHCGGCKDICVHCLVALGLARPFKNGAAVP